MTNNGTYLGRDAVQGAAQQKDQQSCDRRIERALVDLPPQIVERIEP